MAATLQELVEFQGCFPDRALVSERAERFFDTNGYTLESIQEDAQGVFLGAKFERGKRGNGWWSSDMSELHARVELLLTPEDELRLSYTVDVRGQHLSAEDRAFWKSESAEALRYIGRASEEEGGAGEPLPVLHGDEPKDLREQERARASTRSRATLFSSVKGFLMTFMVLAIMMIVLYRMGFIGL